MAEDNLILISFPRYDAPTETERALILLRNAARSLGVHIDRSTGYGVIQTGGEIATVIPLEDDPEWFAVIVKEATLLRLPLSDGDDFGLTEAACDALTHSLIVANRGAG